MSPAHPGSTGERGGNQPCPGFKYQLLQLPSQSGSRTGAAGAAAWSQQQFDECRSGAKARVAAWVEDGLQCKLGIWQGIG